MKARSAEAKHPRTCITWAISVQSLQETLTESGGGGGWWGRMVDIGYSQALCPTKAEMIKG